MSQNEEHFKDGRSVLDFPYNYWERVQCLVGHPVQSNAISFTSASGVPDRPSSPQSCVSLPDQQHNNRTEAKAPLQNTRPYCSAVGDSPSESGCWRSNSLDGLEGSQVPDVKEPHCIQTACPCAQVTRFSVSLAPSQSGNKRWEQRVTSIAISPRNYHISIQNIYYLVKCKGEAMTSPVYSLRNVGNAKDNYTLPVHKV
ncbi:hypothetical protein KCU88_g267, partial [Aureobasidium melanogenum]